MPKTLEPSLLLAYKRPEWGWLQTAPPWGFSTWQNFWTITQANITFLQFLQLLPSWDLASLIFTLSEERRVSPWGRAAFLGYLVTGWDLLCPLSPFFPPLSPSLHLLCLTSRSDKDSAGHWPYSSGASSEFSSWPDPAVLDCLFPSFKPGFKWLTVTLSACLGWNPSHNTGKNKWTFPRNEKGTDLILLYWCVHNETWGQHPCNLLGAFVCMCVWGRGMERVDH